MEFGDLARQNPWWTNKENIDQDPKIRDYDAASIQWQPRLLKYLDLSKDAFYSLRGPRQVGKTTLAKTIIRQELQTRKPCDIFYFACDLISSPAELKSVVDLYLDWASRQSTERKIILLDEVTLVKGWEYAYKLIVDSYSLTKKTFILTGSSCWDLKHGVERLGGRKGESQVPQNHKILLPMKFSEYVVLRSERLRATLDKIGLLDSSKRKSAFLDLFAPTAHRWLDPLLAHGQELEALLDEYFLTGGVMPAVNQLYGKKLIRNNTYELYLQLLFGDVVKMGRNEGTAKKVLRAILTHQGKPVGWTTLQKESGIPTSLTIMEYAENLQTLFVLNIYHAYDQNKHHLKMRSEKKMTIPNPFFFHAIRGYLENPAGDYFQSARDFLGDPMKKSILVESLVGDHLARLAYQFAPSDMYDQSDFVFYARNKSGEQVDFMVRVANQIIPVEVKYQNKINPEDYKGLSNFRKGLMVSKSHLEVGTGRPCIPLHMFLLFV